MNWTAQYFYPHSWRAAARRPVSRPPKHGICQFLYGEFLPLVYYIGILRWKLRASMKRKRTNPSPAKKLDYSTRQPWEAVEQIVVNIQIPTTPQFHMLDRIRNPHFAGFSQRGAGAGRRLWRGPSPAEIHPPLLPRLRTCIHSLKRPSERFFCRPAALKNLEIHKGFPRFFALRGGKIPRSPGIFAYEYRFSMPEFCAPTSPNEYPPWR